MIDFVKTHPFNFSPFQDDVLIVGKKGEGKTEKGKQITTTIPEIPYWIWDYSNKFQGFGHLVHSLDQLAYGQFVIQATDKSKENYGRFLDKAFNEFSNLVIITDELHQYTNKNEVFQPLYHFILSGRNRGLNSIFMTTRPQSVPNYILTNISHLFAYRLSLQSDIDWLKDYIGQEAWLLIPKDKRKFYVEPEAPDVLPKFSYIYRNMDDAKPYIVIP